MNTKPVTVLLTVVDGSKQLTDGYAECVYGDKAVKCIAPINVADVRKATTESHMLIWALPPNPDAMEDFYMAIGFAR